MNKFNEAFSLVQNIKGGLWSNGKQIDDVAKELKISAQNIRVAISRKFKRNGNITPQDKRVVIYLIENCEGFKEWSEQNDISIAS